MPKSIVCFMVDTSAHMNQMTYSKSTMFSIVQEIVLLPSFPLCTEREHCESLHPRHPYRHFHRRVHR